MLIWGMGNRMFSLNVTALPAAMLVVCTKADSLKTENREVVASVTFD